MELLSLGMVIERLKLGEVAVKVKAEYSDSIEWLNINELDFLDEGTALYFNEKNKNKLQVYGKEDSGDVILVYSPFEQKVKYKIMSVQEYLGLNK